MKGCFSVFLIFETLGKKVIIILFSNKILLLAAQLPTWIHTYTYMIEGQEMTACHGFIWH